MRRALAGGGLLVSYKALLDRIKAPAKIHLGNLRGQDVHKNRDVAVVAGRLEPAPLVIERMARALFGDDDEPLTLIEPDAAGVGRYPSEPRRYRMADGSAGPAVDVSVHPDPRAQAILEQTRERELEQAIARLRLVHRAEPATVYLLTNLLLDIGVTELTSWSTLVRDRAADACHRWQGVWLVSYAERARCAPDLWASPGAAEQDERRGKGSTERYRDSSIALRRPFLPNYPGWTVTAAATLVEYRREGQRGSPHQAYLPVAIVAAAAAQAALEAVTGPVPKLQVVGTVRRERPGVIVDPSEPPPLTIVLPFTASTAEERAQLPARLVPSRGWWRLGPARRPPNIPLPPSWLLPRAVPR